MASSVLVRSLEAAAAALEGSAAELNVLDSYGGDGDFGITMTAAAQALKAVLTNSDDISTAQLLTKCGATIAREAPSTSGTLVATGFLRAGKVVANSLGGAGPEVFERAFSAAMEGIQSRGKASVGDRTLVDGLDAVCSSLRQGVAAGSDLREAIRAAAEAAQATADATIEMVPKVGRGSWVPERATGHPDAGCVMLAIVLKAVAVCVAGER